MNRSTPLNSQFSFKGVGSSGFTLVEMIVCLLLLGILAAIAVPHYFNVTNTAQQNAVTAVAGSLASASANNYAVRSANPSLGIAVSNCQHIASALPGGALPSGFQIVSQGVGSGLDVSCTVVRTSNTSIQASFMGTGIN